MVWQSRHGNIFSFTKIEDKYHITYDSTVESAFNVHTENRSIKFHRSAERLYYYKPKYKTGTIMVKMVEANKSFFTDHLYSWTKRAHELLRELGFVPPLQISSESSRWILSRTVLLQQKTLILLKNIWTWCSILKGQECSSKPISSCEWCYWNPKRTICNQYNVDLFIGTMFVNSLAFLTTVSKAIKLRTCDYKPNRKVVEYKTALTKVICQYIDAGFNIRCIFSDQELQPVLQHFKEVTSAIDLNMSNSNGHVPEVEWNNHTLQEQMHVAFPSLPIQAIPAIFIKYLASETAEKLNIFPAIGGISSFYSPCKILTKQHLDYEKHCTIP